MFQNNNIFNFLLNIYNYNILIFYFFILFIDKKFILINEDDLINYIFKYINKCGVVSLKFTQWITCRLSLNFKSKYIKLFENIYENCNIHDITYSKYIFKKDLNINLFDMFDEKDFKIIASGSIGQVYKAKYINKDEYVALKIIHPNTSIQTIYPKLIIKTLNFLFFKILKKLYIPCDFNTFFDSLENQLNLNNEYENLNFFYNKYLNNDYVIIPKPILSSKNILISSFEDGIFYDDHDVSDYMKSQFVILFVLFLRQSILMDGLIHADLHRGNWKIRYNNNKDYKLIIYDVGYCIKEDIYIVRNFINSWELGNSEELCKSFTDMIKNLKNEEKVEIKNLLKENIVNSLLLKPLTLSIIIPKVTKFFLDRNLLLSGNSINIFIILILIEDVLKKNGFVTDENKNLDISQSSEMHYKVNHLNLITYCETNKCFIELSNYLKDSLRKNKCFNELFPNIEILLNNNDKNFKFENLDNNNNIISYDISI